MDNIVSGNFSNIEAKIEIARNLIREQNFTQARKFLEELAKLSAKNPEINYLLGQLYELDANFEKAADCYENLLCFDLSKELKIKLAQCFMDAERFEDAYDLYKELYQNCNDISIIEQFAHVARIMEEITEATEAYNRILDFDKNNIVALTQLSEIYYDLEDKMNHYLVKAKLNYLENMFSNSINCFKKALNYSQNNDEIVNILMNLAKVLVETKKYEEALDQYLFVLNIEPENAYAQQQIDMINQKIEEKDDYYTEGSTWFEKLFIYLNLV